MLVSHARRSRYFAVLLGVSLIGLLAPGLRAQQTLPWSGIAADESRPDGGAGIGFSVARERAISANGQFIAFDSDRTLVAGDTNGVADVFVRDRFTGALSRVSVAGSGAEANGLSNQPVVSADGRHVVFYSLATNLDPADTNSQLDLYVHDRQTGDTRLVSVGPDGEAFSWNSYLGYRLSATGRFVAFVGQFPGVYGAIAFLRDRDPDGNGIFDEPGLAMTTAIDSATAAPYTVGPAAQIAISDDGRTVAYIAGANDAQYNWLGNRVFVYDRELATTVRVDEPLAGNAETVAFAAGLDLSNAGHVVFSSTAAGLAIGDTDSNFDVFVADFANGQRARLLLTHANAPALTEATMPVISGDGRFVAFTGLEFSPAGDVYNVFAIDRNSGLSYEVSVLPDGSRHNQSSGAAITADGSAVSFTGTPTVLANGSGYYGVFVATTVALSPSGIEVPAEGGTFQVEVTVPANIAWTMANEYGWEAQMVPASGVGPATIEVTIPTNLTTEPKTHVITLGSESVTFNQPVMLLAEWLTPSSGPAGGGSEVEISGGGFMEGAIVTFAGVPATNVVVLDTSTILATTPAHAAGEWVNVTVTNANGATTELYNAFYYEQYDSTPPEITPAVDGTLGPNGWYTSTVTVAWSVQDNESGISSQSCDPTPVTADTTGDVITCTATSDGGTASQQVVIRRDTVAPAITITEPAEAQTYIRNQSVTLSYTCDDGTSGIESCASSQADPLLNTAMAGTFTFTVTGTDLAGHVTSTDVPYTVIEQITPELQWTTPPFLVEGDVLTNAQLNATAGIPGTFAYSPDFGAVLAAGTHTLSATFTPQDAVHYTTSTATVTVVVKARPTLTWGSPAAVQYPYALNALQLNATASTSGTFSYTPSASTVLPAGTHTLSVTFTPFDSQNYESATVTTTLLVGRATPAVMWAFPANITLGTPLGPAQLNATANVPGTFNYYPPAGTILEVGQHWLTVSFTPDDAANYGTGSSDASITVDKAPTSVAWNAPADIFYGVPLSSAQLNATSSVAGTLAYSPAAGTVLSAGTHTLAVIFAPTDQANYTSSSTTVSITVAKKALTVQADNANKVYGQALPAFTASGTGFVNGDGMESLSGPLSFSTSATATSVPGNYDVTPSGATSPDYTITFAAGTLTVAKASSSTTLTTSPSPSNHNQSVQMQALVAAVAPGAGTPTGPVQFRRNGVLLGTANLVNGVATLTKKFSRGTHTVTATYVASTNFNSSVGTKSHVVN